MGDEGMGFERSKNTLGVDFGRQIALRSYKVRRACFEDLRGELTTTQGEGMSEEGFDGLPIYVYRQSYNSMKFQRAWSTMTLGIATCRAKVIVFYFDNLELKRYAKTHWPSALRLSDVQSQLFDKAPQFEFARYQIRKGLLTFYLYAVKRINTSFQEVTNFRELKNLIDNLNDTNDPSSIDGEQILIIILRLIQMVGVTLLAL